MKIKNLILGAAATVFAVGGAIASNTLVMANYAQTSPRCRAIQPIECGVSGANICQALIGGVTYPVYVSRQSANVCSTPVTTQETGGLPSVFLD